jgi:hypothetical protein
MYGAGVTPNILSHHQFISFLVVLGYEPRSGGSIYRARGAADVSQKDEVVAAGGPVSTVHLPPRSRDGVPGLGDGAARVVVSAGL